MSNKTILILIIFCLKVFGEPTISFYIKPYPRVSLDKINKKSERKLAIPGYLGYKILKRGIPSSNEGIPCFYAGQITFSDANGLVRFERVKLKNDFDLIISDKIAPIFSIPWVIEDWSDELKRAAWYSIHGFTDKQTQKQLWETKSQEPKTEISNFGIIIFNSQNDIYVPEGISYAVFDQQIILPTIYSKAKNYSPLQALEALKLKQFFAPVKTLFKLDNELITQIQTN
jgi:hypothetical protein